MTIAADIKARLEAINPPVFNEVGTAADFAGLVSDPLAMPAAYVVMENEISAESEHMTGPVLQRTAVDVAIVIFTRNVSDNTGGAGAEDIETLKMAVRRALLGFMPPSAEDAEPIEHIEGAMLKVRNGVVCWRDLFGTAYLQQETI